MTLPRRCIRIKAALYDRLYDHSKEIGSSVSALVECIIAESLSGNPPPKEGEDEEPLEGYVKPITYL